MHGLYIWVKNILEKRMLPKCIVAILTVALFASSVAAQPRKPTDDLNGDGKVTVAEYAEARSARYMERVDRDKDGKVSADEQAAVSGAGIGARASLDGAKARVAGGIASRAGAESSTASEIAVSTRARATAMDANGDGVLSREELIGNLGAAPAK
jgi:hypothetical protein